MKKNTQKRSWWRRSGDKLPLIKSIFYISLSVFFISGSAATALLFYKEQNKQKQKDPKYTIVAIVQTGPDRDRLKTVFLSDLLELSIDKPQNLYSFSLSEAKKKICKCPVVKSCNLKKISPGTLYVEYSIRKPIAYIGDFSNTAVDAEGIMIPFQPFFSPKRLPKISLGMPYYKAIDNGMPWGSHINPPEFTIFAEIISALERCSDLRVDHIDLSNIFMESPGKKEIIVELSDHSKGELPITLRLNAQKFLHSIEAFFTMRSQLTVGYSIVDLRMQPIGLISSFPDS